MSSTDQSSIAEYSVLRIKNFRGVANYRVYLLFVENKVATCINSHTMKFDYIRLSRKLFTTKNVYYNDVKVRSPSDIEEVKRFGKLAEKSGKEQKCVEIKPEASETKQKAEVTKDVDQSNSCIVNVSANTSSAGSMKYTNFVRGSVCSSSSDESIRSLRSIYSDIERRAINQSEYIQDLVKNEAQKQENVLVAKMNELKDTMMTEFIKIKDKMMIEFLEHREATFKDIGKFKEEMKSKRAFESLPAYEQINRFEKESKEIDMTGLATYELRPNIIVAPTKVKKCGRSRVEGGLPECRPEKFKDGLPECRPIKLKKKKSMDECIKFIEMYREYSFLEVMNLYISGPNDKARKLFERFKEDNKPDIDVYLRDLYYIIE